MQWHNSSMRCGVKFQKVPKLNISINLLIFVSWAQIILGMIASFKLSECKLPLRFEHDPIHKWMSTSPLKRSKEYCNAPGQQLTGLEGVPPDLSMQLIGLVLLVRHGDRLPISRPVAVHKHPAVMHNHCHLNVHETPGHELLHPYIRTVFQHHKVIKEFLNPALRHFDLLPDTCSDVSVTQTGIVQMLELGSFLGKRYMGHLWNKTQDEKQDIVISTSRFARTFQSLLSFVFGFSPKEFLKILCDGIDTSSSIYFCDSDLQMAPSSKKHCHCTEAMNIPHLRASFRFWDLNLPSISHLYHFLKVNEEHQSQLIESPVVLKKIGPPPLQVTSPSRVWDWLVSDYYCAGQPLPCVSSNDDDFSICLNSSVVKDLLNLVDANHLRMVRNANYVKAARLAMHPFLTSVSEKFQELFEKYSLSNLHTEQPKKPRNPFLWIISGHDVTMGPLLMALNQTVLTKVRYATRVAFELWESDCSQLYCNNKEKTPYMRILYNGKVVTHLLRNHDQPANDWFCGSCDAMPLMTLSEFDAFLKSDFFKTRGSLNNMTACGDYQSKADLL